MEGDCPENLGPLELPYVLKLWEGILRRVFVQLSAQTCTTYQYRNYTICLQHRTPENVPRPVVSSLCMKKG